MAPDQESSSVVVDKNVDIVCDVEEPIKNGVLGEVINGLTITDVDKGEPNFDLCSEIRLEWFQVKRVGAGLANLGNTCFLNTVIQCLTYCPPLANYLLQNDHCSTCQSFEFCMMCELQKHVREALEHSGDVIEPVQIYENIKLIAEHFQSGQQEDAHEFLRFVIENLRRNTEFSYCGSSSNSESSLDSAVRETTVVNNIFGGYNRSQVICLKCKKISNMYEHCMDLILDIKHNANTLQKALEQYVKPEILEKDNAYNCPQCKALVSAQKTYTIHKAPNVATIQLKRFDYNKSHGGKITKHVSYPENLDLQPFMSEKTGSAIMYKLNAVLVHTGQNCNSGHYFCYIRNSNGSWYLMDDAKVQRVGLGDVLNQQAYLLFYVRTPVSNRQNVKKNGISLSNGSRLLNGRLGSKGNTSGDNVIRKKKFYAPLSKWMSYKRNRWDNRNRSNLRYKYNSSHGDSHGSSSSSSVDSERCSRESSSSTNRFDDISADNFDGCRYTNSILPVDNRNDNSFERHIDSFYGRYYQDKDFANNRFEHNGPVNQRYQNENCFNRRGSDFHQSPYDRQMYRNKNLNRHASDTHLYAVSDYGYRRGNEMQNSSSAYGWESNNRNKYFPNSNAGMYKNRGFADSSYPDNRWKNWNDLRGKQQIYNINKYYDEQERDKNRKFHMKSKSMDFACFPRRQCNPYYTPRRRLQACM